MGETNGWSAGRKLLEMDGGQAAERRILASQGGYELDMRNEKLPTVQLRF